MSAGSSHLDAPNGGQLSERERQLVALFKPRPLPALAAAGKQYRSARKMPRKCDISAPCLFQHVGRVSASQLTAIESSLEAKQPVAAGAAISSRESAATAGRQQVAAAAKSQQHAASSSLGSTSGFTSCSMSESSSASYSSSSLATAGDQSDSAVANSEPSETSNSNKTTTTPVGGRTQQVLLAKMRLVGQPTGRLAGRAPRPPPPPPVRVPELHGQPSGGGATGVACVADTSDAKIKAMLRELESQASAEMVSAKRELMADIAGQLKNSGKIRLKSVQAKRQQHLALHQHQHQHQQTQSRLGQDQDDDSDNRLSRL